MEKGDDPYEILGVERTATDTEIKKAYRKLALVHHPDRQTNELAKHNAKTIFAKISGAYEILGNENSRIIYDSLQRDEDSDSDSDDDNNANSTGAYSTSAYSTGAQEEQLSKNAPGQRARGSKTSKKVKKKKQRGFDPDRMKFDFNSPYEVWKRDFEKQFGFPYPGAQWDFDGQAEKDARLLSSDDESSEDEADRKPRTKQIIVRPSSSSAKNRTDQQPGTEIQIRKATDKARSTALVQRQDSSSSSGSGSYRSASSESTHERPTETKPIPPDPNAGIPKKPPRLNRWNGNTEEGESSDLVVHEGGNNPQNPEKSSAASIGSTALGFFTGRGRKNKKETSDALVPHTGFKQIKKGTSDALVPHNGALPAPNQPADPDKEPSNAIILTGGLTQDNRPLSMITTEEVIVHDDGVVETITTTEMERPDGTIEIVRKTDRADKRPDWQGRKKKEELPQLTAAEKKEELPKLTAAKKKEELPKLTAAKKKEELPKLTDAKKKKKEPKLPQLTDADPEREQFQQLTNGEEEKLSETALTLEADPNEPKRSSKKHPKKTPLLTNGESAAPAAIEDSPSSRPTEAGAIVLASSSAAVETIGGMDATYDEAKGPSQKEAKKEKKKDSKKSTSSKKKEKKDVSKTSPGPSGKTKEKKGTHRRRSEKGEHDNLKNDVVEKTSSHYDDSLD